MADGSLTLPRPGAPTDAADLAVTGFQLRTVVDRLCVDLLRILAQEFASTARGDRCVLALLVTLSRRVYREGLLYRSQGEVAADAWLNLPSPDGAPVRIHQRALSYYDLVLGRRLSLARRLGTQPTNMHRLAEALLRHAPADHPWKDARIARQHDAGGAAPASANDGGAAMAFARAARPLQRQIKALGDDYSAVSVTQRAAAGPITLIAKGGSAEMPEELSLFDVLDLVPRPLDPAWLNDSDVQKLLARCLDSLNERFMLLRGCGLDPDDWYQRDEPSIAVLRDLRRLKQTARQLESAEAGMTWPIACRSAYERLAEPGKSFAGSRDFAELSRSEWGMTVLGGAMLSLDQPLGDGENAGHLGDLLPDPGAEGDFAAAEARIDLIAWVERLDQRPNSPFTPALRLFFRDVLAQDKALFAPPSGAYPGLLQHGELREALDADPVYAALDERARAERLYHDAERLIRRHLTL